MTADDLRIHFHPDHWADLLSSGLTPETIHAHGLYSARPGDIPKLVGWAPKDLQSALVFPYPGQEGFCRIKCFPAITNGNGHTIRYLQKKGTGVRLYIPHLAASVLKDPGTPLHWTEGEKKSLRANQDGLPCIALGGLWNWIEHNSALEGLDDIAHVNRVERFYPDHDVWARQDLLKAVYAFAREIEARGGLLQIGILPATLGEQKLDEFLQRHSRQDLEALPHIDRRHKAFTGFASWWRSWRQTKLTGKRQGKRQQPTHRVCPYRILGGRLTYLAERPGLLGVRTLEPVPIADFSAQITEELCAENGRRLFVITGRTIHQEPFTVEVASPEFADERALKAALTTVAGARAPVHAGMTKHLGPAIQLLTTDEVRQTRRYERTGWAGDRFMIPGREPPQVSISLPRKLPYAIHPTANLNEGLKAFQALLESMPRAQTTVAATLPFKAPLAPMAGWRDERSAVFIKGRTGSFKTSWAQLLMAIYGPHFLQDSLLIKLGQGATTNAIMSLATHAHDLPFLIDNYKPSTGGGAKDLINLLHNILEGGEKDRLSRASELRETRPIFCWPLVTGEDVPDTDPATLARMLIIPFHSEPGSSNPKLTEAQEGAAHLCAVGASWLTWLETADGREAVEEEARKFADVRDGWAATLREAYPKMANMFRVATNLAITQLTWQIMQQHPVIGPAIEDYTSDHTTGLTTLMHDMGSYTTESLEASRFLTMLVELLTSQRIQLLNYPNTPTTDNEREHMIGWKQKDGSVYLLPDLAREAIERTMGRDSLGGLSDRTLHSQLASLGLIKSRDQGRFTVNRKIDGKSTRLLHLAAAAITGSDEAERDHP
jgi:hypothetical protein